jgi:hypothetical protein
MDFCIYSWRVTYLAREVITRSAHGFLFVYALSGLIVVCRVGVGNLCLPFFSSTPLSKTASLLRKSRAKNEVNVRSDRHNLAVNRYSDQYFPTRSTTNSVYVRAPTVLLVLRTKNEVNILVASRTRMMMHRSIEINAMCVVVCVSRLVACRLKRTRAYISYVNRIIYLT